MSDETDRNRDGHTSGCAVEGAEVTVLSVGPGRFQPMQPGTATVEGEMVASGGVLAVVGSDPVHAPCDAWIMDVLASGGEHVVEGQPLFRIRRF